MTFDDFVAKHDLVKPYALMDLDDTLFQTKRKPSNASELITASHDKQGNPLSFLALVQKYVIKKTIRGELCLLITIFLLADRLRANGFRSKFNFVSCNIFN
ncbi:hypothetical protein [Moraxella equi]|uniref:Uncharacterized protein n=1 Tax=Moraxella equi TaxID=60442 RepID=A0A378QUF1_9GAMM|nr:hypothetical protein [Moraxella equi]OPH40155.1 hypothetical protein B5J93_00585 [Moraxella equi]STZ03043.1 Uncharacterised protein [Moraxella equi]